jgi:hypothetical protein
MFRARSPMRAPVSAILLAGACALLPATPTPTQAQGWRASVLALPAAASVAGDSVVSPAVAAPDSARAMAPRPVPRPQPSIAGPIAGGVFSAGLGALGGALLGAEADHGSDEFIPVGAVLGFLAGEAVLMPMGVHFGNGRRGNFAADLGTSIVGGACAIALGAATRSGAGYLVGIGAQIGLTVWTERRVADHKARAAAARAAPAAPADTTRRTVTMPAPPPEPDPLVPPPAPTK